MDFENLVPKDTLLNSNESQLRIILSNLISNAIKYKDVGKVKPFVKVYVNRDSQKTEITIEDNGIGISPEHHDKIFESYFTIGSSPDSKGLGLVNVKNAVEKLKGQIKLISEPGIGSKFIIILPIG